MTRAALDLYTALLSAGVTLRADGGRLLLSPREAITPELDGLIRQHRDELLALVTALPPPEQQAYLDHRTASGWSPFRPCWSEPDWTEAEWAAYRQYESDVNERWLKKLAAKAGDHAAKDSARKQAEAEAELEPPPKTLFDAAKKSGADSA